MVVVHRERDDQSCGVVVVVGWGWKGKGNG